MPEGPPQVPTDIHIDASTGEVSIKKGPVNIRVAWWERPDADEVHERMLE